MLIRPLSLLALLIAPLAATAADTGFLDREFKNDDGTISKYVVFVPTAADAKSPMPIILSLHGSGETKGGKKMPVEVGIGTEIKKHEKTFPFIVVIPQAEKRPWSADSEDGKRAIAILDATEKEYKVDPKRVYLTGLSMGGYGTWSMAAKFPNRWAAIVPICGGGDPKNASAFKDIPCWCFHGDKDPSVKVEKSREMIEALKKAGGNPKYTEYPGVPHDSWTQAYATEELWVWLGKQAKK